MKSISERVREGLTPYISGLDVELREALAYRADTGPDVLDVLSFDEEYCVRQGVSVNLRTPSAVLSRLATDEDYKVRINVAEHPNTPVDSLTLLAVDDEEMVRRGVAENANAPAEALRKVVEGNFDSVRLALAVHPNASADVLASVAAREIVTVSQRLAEPTKVINALQETMGPTYYDKVLEAIAAHPNTSGETLELLCSDVNLNVEELVVRNPNVPKHVLESMAASSWSELRENAREVLRGLPEYADYPDEWFAELYPEV